MMSAHRTPYFSGQDGCVGFLGWRTWIVFLAVALSCATAAAQPAAPEPLSDSPRAAGFLERFDFQIALARLSGDDPRLVWDTHVGGVIDIVDYVRGRASIVADYSAVLGEEYRPFDPNQSYYTLEGSASWRFGGTEVAGVFHHVSRHLSDRPKPFAIAWNGVGARVLRSWSFGANTADVRATGQRITQRSYVDYTWMGDIDAGVRHRVTSTLAAFGRARGELVGTNERLGRGTQRGGSIEVGARLNGDAAAVEFFAGIEQRIDGDPLALQSVRWASAGFRLIH
jgi:hypothetical protein